MKNSCPDRNTYAEKLRLSDLLRGPLFRSLIGSLELPEGSCGLDIGCGTGSNTLLLAEAVGGSGHVAGIDLSEELLAHAVQRAQESGISRRTSFIKCDMNRLAFSEHAFDWAWSADCAGYAPGDAASLTGNIAKLVKPGGNLFFLAWSSQQLLPGHPQLEARLNATCAGIAPFVEGQGPETHFLRAAGWFRGAELKEIKARTYVGDIQAPLDNEQRRAMASLFEMRWGDGCPELTQEERMEYWRLCSPDSTDFMPHRHDYYGFFTYTLFQGRVAG